MAAWTDLENAIVTALSAAGGPAAVPPGPLRTVKSYAGELDGAPADAQGLLPGAFVFCTGSGWKRESSGGRLYREDVTVSVVVATRHPGGNLALRQGTAADRDAGIYAILDAVEATLIDRAYGDYQALAPKRRVILSRDLELTAYAVEFGAFRKVDTEELRGTTWEDLDWIRAGFEEPVGTERVAAKIDTHT